MMNVWSVYDRTNSTNFRDICTVREFHIAPNLGFNAPVIVTPLDFLEGSKTLSFISRSFWLYVLSTFWILGISISLSLCTVYYR